MKQNHLAKLAGISPKHVSDLKAGKCGFTRERAAQFEKITGIPSYMWVYPDKFGDPWKELKNLHSPEPLLGGRQTGFLQEARGALSYHPKEALTGNRNSNLKTGVPENNKGLTESP